MRHTQGALSKALADRNHRFSEKEDRQISHILESEKARGLSDEEARKRAYGHVVALKKK